MRSRSSTHGFSLIELMAVVAIILILAAVSVPAIGRSLALYRLNNAAAQVSNLIQRGRYEAIKQNTTMRVRRDVADGRPRFYVDLNNDGAWQANEPMVLLPPQVDLLEGGEAPDGATLNLGAVSASPEVIAFNGRGTVEFGGGGTTAYAYYLGYGSQADYGFRAVGVSPMGRTRVYRAAHGGQWSAQ
jgi:prepilin-type N-terminal cleavage/methylation domain-containing protein